MKIGITGGTGFVGRALTRALLQDGHHVLIFTRDPAKAPAQTGVSYAAWEPEAGLIDDDALRDLDACVHLAGAGVAEKRWTAARKREIAQSRVAGTTLLVQSLRLHAPHCKTLISASAIGWYGPDVPGGAPFREDAPPASDFLGTTCVRWEAAAAPAAGFLRLVIPRFGIVLGKGGGAFPQLSRALPFRIQPILGDGRQMVSWIHLDDLVRMLLFLLDQRQLTGVYNAVAPQPVSHKVLMDALAKAHGGPHLPLPVPEALLAVALGEMRTEVLKSCTVSADKALTAGFDFTYGTIERAAAALMR